MLNTKISHSEPKILLQQQNHQKNKDAHGDVRQDKRGKTSARTASPQPARTHTPMRAEPSNTKTPRTQNAPSTYGPKEQLCLWVDPIVKAEIHRRAKRERLYPSTVGAALLKRGLQEDLDLEYGALLIPVFENVLKRYMTARDNRLASLLVRACIAIEQTRSIAVNTLGRQPKITPAVLNEILDQSLKDAKKKITNRSPELKDLINELHSWLVDEETGEK
jgi:hypothetical protein